MADNVALPSLDGKEITKEDTALSGGYNGPELKVSGIFSSHMVLQRDKPIKIFGFSFKPGCGITENSTEKGFQQLSAMTTNGR